jgi:hypothetical protein
MRGMGWEENEPIWPFHWLGHGKEQSAFRLRNKTREDPLGGVILWRRGTAGSSGLEKCFAYPFLGVHEIGSRWIPCVFHDTISSFPKVAVTQNTRLSVETTFDVGLRK